MYVSNSYLSAGSLLCTFMLYILALLHDTIDPQTILRSRCFSKENRDGFWVTSPKRSCHLKTNKRLNNVAFNRDVDYTLDGDKGGLGIIRHRFIQRRIWGIDRISRLFIQAKSWRRIWSPIESHLVPTVENCHARCFDKFTQFFARPFWGKNARPATLRRVRNRYCL